MVWAGSIKLVRELGLVGFKFFSEKNENSDLGNLLRIKLLKNILSEFRTGYLNVGEVGDNFVILVTGLANMSPIDPIFLHERLALTL